MLGLMRRRILEVTFEGGGEDLEGSSGRIVLHFSK
jgi:hypothetical protein